MREARRSLRQTALAHSRTCTPRGNNERQSLRHRPARRSYKRHNIDQCNQIRCSIVNRKTFRVDGTELEYAGLMDVHEVAAATAALNVQFGVEPQLPGLCVCVSLRYSLVSVLGLWHCFGLWGGRGQLIFVCTFRKQLNDSRTMNWNGSCHSIWSTRFMMVRGFMLSLLFVSVWQRESSLSRACYRAWQQR